ncbi:MAG: ABC transporter ATP-binding protein [Bacteroidota bacterium]
MQATTTRPMRRLFRYLGNYRKSVRFAVSTSIINKILDLMPPFLTAWLIDSVSGNIPAWISQWTGLIEPWPVVVFVMVLTAAIFLGESFFEWLFKRTFMRLAQRVQHDLRIDAYRKLQHRELAFFETQRTGNLMAILNDDINQLERFLNNSFNEIVQLITLFLFAGWSLCAVSLQLGLVGMIPIPFILIGSFYYQKKIAPYYKDVRESVGHLGNRLENNISGILVIKSYTAEKFEEKRVAEVSESYRDANFAAIQWSSVYVPLIRIFITVGFVLTLLIGAYWVLFEPGRFSLGSLAFFAMMIQRLLWPVTRLGTVFDDYERARASARRVFELIDGESLIVSPESPRQVQEVRGSIELEQLAFSYVPDQPIIQNLSLRIAAGQTIGVAGTTGAGKTTLIKLLFRLYDPTAGAIKLDGHDLRDLDLSWLRRQMALVSQDVYLFHGTIEENIRYGMEEVNDLDLREACQKAQILDFIEGLPQGFSTIVGERGIKLSGGQRQRISIARAILKDAPILILDEATSAVDTETEKAIQQHLNVLTTGKTAIIIAHRLSTIRQADQIVVLGNQGILEQGSHPELLAREGVYADLWNTQIGVQNTT